MKTEKSKWRPGKSAHVALDVKPAPVYAATIRSKEVASRTLVGDGRGADSTVKILGKYEPMGPSCRTVSVCLGPMKTRLCSPV